MTLSEKIIKKSFRLLLYLFLLLFFFKSKTTKNTLNIILNNTFFQSKTIANSDLFEDSSLLNGNKNDINKFYLNNLNKIDINFSNLYK